MSYRAAVESDLPVPPTKPILWNVYYKPEKSLKTQVMAKYWYNAREEGCTKLMISLGHFIDIGLVEAELA